MFSAKTPTAPIKSYINLKELLKELELMYNLSPKLSKNQIKKLQQSFDLIVREAN